MGFAGIVLVVYFVTSLKDKAVGSAVGAVNRKVSRKTHEEGLEYARNTYVFEIDGPESGVTDVVNAMRVGVKAGSKPTLSPIASTYVTEASPSRIRWVHGNKFVNSFTATAVVEDDLSGEGCQRRVRLEFSNLSVADGIVADVSAMRALRHDVLVSLQKLDPTTKESVVT